jgi:hypothetical protein
VQPGAEADSQDPLQHVHLRRSRAAPYLAAILAVLDIVDSDEGDELRPNCGRSSSG